MAKNIFLFIECVGNHEHDTIQWMNEWNGLKCVFERALIRQRSQVPVKHKKCKKTSGNAHRWSFLLASDNRFDHLDWKISFGHISLSAPDNVPRWRGVFILQDNLRSTLWKWWNDNHATQTTTMKHICMHGWASQIRIITWHLDVLPWHNFTLISCRLCIQFIELHHSRLCPQ